MTFLSRSKLIKQGEQLIQLIWELALDKGPRMGHKSHIKYKDFEKLLVVILSANRMSGGHLKSVLHPIRDSLTIDLKWEKSLAKEYREGLVQFVLTAIVTWLFAFISLWILQGKLGSLYTTLILLIQSSGIFCFHYLIWFVEKRQFSGLFTLNHKLIKFEAMLSSRLSVQEILLQSGISSSKEALQSSANDQDTGPLWRVVARIVKKWRYYGEPITEEVAEIRNEVSFKFNQKFEIFLDQVKVLKFMILAFFFLAPYFLMIVGLLESFLIE